MNGIETFNFVNNLCKFLFKNDKWKITKYKISNETAFVEIFVLKNEGIKEIEVNIEI